MTGRANSVCIYAWSSLSAEEPALKSAANAAGQNWVRFSRFTPRPSRAPYDNCPCPRTPVHPSLALFCTFCLRASLAPDDDSPCPRTPVHPSLALFCAFTARPGQIGFVSHVSARRSRARGACCRSLPASVIASVAKQSQPRELALFSQRHNPSFSPLTSFHKWI
jgi:hypothetical protein